jgi:hypothetical protein
VERVEQAYFAPFFGGEAALRVGMEPGIAVGTVDLHAPHLRVRRSQDGRRACSFILTAEIRSRSTSCALVLLSMRQGPVVFSKKMARGKHPWLSPRRLPPARCKRIVPERCWDARVDRVLDCRCRPAIVPCGHVPTVRPSYWGWLCARSI